MGRMVPWAGRLAAVMLLAALVAPVAGAAQGWVKLPNGGYGYATDYTTSGMFMCGNRRYLMGSCTASGNALTLTSDQGSWTTFAFTGFSGNIFATPQSRRIALGTLSVTYSDPSAPRLPNFKTVYSVFYFHLAITTTAPLADTGGFGYRNMNLKGGIYPVYYGNETILGTTPSPYPRQYPLRIINPTMEFIALGDEAIDYYASAVVTPEPATIALLATGLAGVAGVARRRRRARERSGATGDVGAIEAARAPYRPSHAWSTAPGRAGRRRACDHVRDGF
jgi:PEP-CTERM motif